MILIDLTRKLKILKAFSSLSLLKIYQNINIALGGLCSSDRGIENALYFDFKRGQILTLTHLLKHICPQPPELDPEIEQSQ